MNETPLVSRTDILVRSALVQFLAKFFQKPRHQNQIGYPIISYPLPWRRFTKISFGMCLFITVVEILIQIMHILETDNIPFYEFILQV